MKFFIGIVPPLATKERIINFQKTFPSNKVPYFNEPHITLKAPTGLTGDKSWLAKVIALAGDYPRFQINIKGIDSFDNRVLFLNPIFSENLMNLHLKLVDLLCPTIEASNKFYEGAVYHPHITLGETTWGGMTEFELDIMRKKAETEFYTIPPFLVTSLRLYQKGDSEEVYSKLLDIPLKI